VSSSVPALVPPPAKEAYSERELELYRQCPAGYYHEIIDDLHGSRDESAYVRFHSCVYRTVRWLENERQAGNAVDVARGLATLEKDWAEDGPEGHPFEKYYRTAAESMVRGMAEAIAKESAKYERAEWVVGVAKRKVLVTPDRVLVGADGSVRVQRVRTGRQTKSEPTKRIYALLRRGAALKYPGKNASIEIFYLATREVISVPPKNDDKLLTEYAESIAGIERGDFHAKPVDPRRCPNCPCYFICGA
jgi:CRISPR/Cas system-associated exonuclease Cas4 (RecB family)